MEEGLNSQLQDVAELLKRQRCKQGLSGLQKAVRDIHRPAHASSSSVIRDTQEQCGVPVTAAHRRRATPAAQDMSDSMAMLHNNRQKLITSIEGLQCASNMLRCSVVSLASSVLPAQCSVPSPEHVDEDAVTPSLDAEASSFQRLGEGSLVGCALCEGLQEECRLWILLGKEGRMDADPDVLYGIDEAVQTLGADLERLFVEICAAGS